jgi:type II secretory pathway pseudopilin PulG
MRRLGPPPPPGVKRRRRGARRPERGSATLAEVIIAMALAALLLGAVGVVAATTGDVVSSSGLALAAQRSAAQVLSQAMSSISDASPLGACLSSNGAMTATTYEALGQCSNVAEDGPAVEAASSSGSETGLCWYSYPDTATGLVPPDLRCLTAFPDGTIWYYDWPAPRAATFTGCDPASCFGTGAPGPGQLPPEPVGPTPGAALAGQVAGPSSAFTFYSQSGATLNLSASSSQAQLAAVYKVTVTVSETYGGPSATTVASLGYRYTAVVGQAAVVSQQLWDAPT